MVGSSVIADWGNKRTYRVIHVDFSLNPVDARFVYNGVETSVAEYMRDVYDRTISDPSQPLIIAKHGDTLIQLVPEFCRIDGVPESIRASPAMRDCLAVCRVTPE